MTASSETVEHAADTVARLDAQITKLRDERERAALDPLDAAIGQLEKDLVLAREAAREATKRDAEATVAGEAKGYVAAFLEAEAARVQAVRGFFPAWNQLLAARGRLIAAHGRLVAARGENPKYAESWDMRAELRAIPLDRAAAFWSLAKRLARAGGSQSVGEPANRCPECGSERE